MFLLMILIPLSLCRPSWQTGDEVNGMVMVRSADNRQGYCPIKYLQEV